MEPIQQVSMAEYAKTNPRWKASTSHEGLADDRQILYRYTEYAIVCILEERVLMDTSRNKAYHPLCVFLGTFGMYST